MYNFPKDISFDVVHKIVKSNKEFALNVRTINDEVFYVITYNIQTQDTFGLVQSEEDALRRELRGIVFNAIGKVVSRPYHKFFNMNERDETLSENIDINEYDLLEKLDGSMIRPIPFANGSFVLATKAGISDVAIEAQSFYNSMNSKSVYDNFILSCISENKTPIFEYISPSNLIVVEYKKTQLILTAIRCNDTGKYETYEDMKSIAKIFSIPCVKLFTKPLSVLNAMDKFEGVVLRHKETGHMIKVKTDWYVLRHKMNDMLSSNKDVISLIINDQIDDVKSKCSLEMIDKLNKFEEDLIVNMLSVANTLTDDFNKIMKMPDADNKKVFATKYVQGVDYQFMPPTHKYFYAAHKSALNGDNPFVCIFNLLRSDIKNSTSSNTKLEANSWLYGNIKWEDYK